MIAHTTWRDLFYKLAEAHPDCLMLNFTVKVVYSSLINENIHKGLIVLASNIGYGLACVFYVFLHNTAYSSVRIVQIHTGGRNCVTDCKQ